MLPDKRATRMCYHPQIALCAIEWSRRNNYFYSIAQCALEIRRNVPIPEIYLNLLYQYCTKAIKGLKVRVPIYYAISASQEADLHSAHGADSHSEHKSHNRPYRCDNRAGLLNESRPSG